MRIAFFVAMRMMLAMIGNPHQGRTFARQAADESQQPADRLVGSEAAVREMTVITEANSQAASHPPQEGRQPQPFPSEEEGGRQRAGVKKCDPSH